MLDRNIRGIDIALCLLTLLLSLSGCGSLKDDTLLIANAVITEIDTEKQTITVKDDVDESTLGEECLLDCSSVLWPIATLPRRRLQRFLLRIYRSMIRLLCVSGARKWRASEAAATRRIRSRSNNCSCIHKDLPNEPRLSNAASRLRDRAREHEVGQPAHQR